jgi:hypothetical protein
MKGLPVGDGAKAAIDKAQAAAPAAAPAPAASGPADGQTNPLIKGKQPGEEVVNGLTVKTF